MNITRLLCSRVDPEKAGKKIQKLFHPFGRLMTRMYNLLYKICYKVYYTKVHLFTIRDLYTVCNLFNTRLSKFYKWLINYRLTLEIILLMMSTCKVIIQKWMAQSI